MPRRRGPLQVAALGAAVLVSVELAMAHWFYLYVVWFAPLALVALLGPYRRPHEPEGSRAAANRGATVELPGHAREPAPA